jgi:hypothetical protein
MKIANADITNPAITNTSWPRRLIQSIPTSYTVWYNSDDSKYYGESNVASLGDITPSTDASTVIQAAINTAQSVFIKDGTYDVSSASIKLQNDKKYHVSGAGKGQTVLNAGNGVNAKVFEIVDSGNNPVHGKMVTLENMCLCANNGYGIHCDFAGHATNSLAVTPHFTFSHLRFGAPELDLFCKYGMKINGIYKPVIDDIEIYGYATNSIGIWLFTTNTDGLACGDGNFRAVRIEQFGTTGIGILLDATLGGSLYASVNLLNFYDLEIIGSATSTGIEFRATDPTTGYVEMINFYGYRMEGLGTGIKFTGASTASSEKIITNIWFEGGDLGCSTANVLGTGTFGFFNTGIIFRHTNFYTAPINLSGMLQYPDARARFHFDKCYDAHTMNLGVAAVDLFFHDCIGGQYMKGTVLYMCGKSIGTGGQETIPHGLTLNASAIAPTRVVLTPNDDGTTTLYESNPADTTNIYVTATNLKHYTYQAFVDTSQIHIAH